MGKKKFTDYLIEQGLISPEDLEKALSHYRNKSESLTELLVKLGYIKENQLVKAFSSYLGIPPVRVLNLNISKDILDLVPDKIAVDYKVLPVAKIGNTLTLAMGDPMNVLAIDDIKKISKCEINPVIAPFSELREALAANYVGEPSESLEDIIKDQKIDDLKIIKEAKKDTASEEVLSIDEAPVIKFTRSIFRRAVEEQASDVLIEPLQYNSRIRFRIDGVLREVQAFPKKIHPFVLSRIKVMCNLNIAEHRLPQEGRFRSNILSRDVDFRVSILPASSGEKAAVRILDKTTALLNLDFLGFEDDILQKLKEDSLRPHGLLLACGPTGSGKTTTLYSVINHIYAPEKNIITVEDPIEYQLRGINQVSINPVIGLTFARFLRAILRQDPDIIMIGEIRDPETADMAIKSSLTGHFVLSTLHTTTSAGSVTRLINMGVEPFLLSSTLIGVITQRLVRKLCLKCREKVEVSKKLAQTYSLEEGSTIFKAKGCSVCQNTGYKGRICLCEYLQANAVIKNLISSSASESRVKKEGRATGMRTLREDGIIKLQKGITTLEEVLKVTNADED